MPHLTFIALTDILHFRDLEIDLTILDQVNREGGIYPTRSEGTPGASFSITCHAHVVNLKLPCQHCDSPQSSTFSTLSAWAGGASTYSMIFPRLYMSSSFDSARHLLLGRELSCRLIYHPPSSDLSHQRCCSLCAFFRDLRHKPFPLLVPPQRKAHRWISSGVSDAMTAARYTRCMSSSAPPRNHIHKLIEMRAFIVPFYCVLTT